jgi:DNA primase
MPSIPDSFLDELVSKTDIYDIVSSYVRLTKRTGSHIFGLCPFHSEKTPSFAVNSDKQIYYCFGCQKGGGVINFIMEIENATFLDAVEILAKRAGMTVPTSDADNELAEKRSRMFQINRDAARYFYEMLSSPLARTAHNYLAKRGISKQMVKRFGIGFAPQSWNQLIDSMTYKGYSLDEIVGAGLAKSGTKKLDNGTTSAYDVFRNRLMFPVIDTRGNVLGFSGRILDDGEPKYLNSRETLVYNKRRSLFALNLAKKTKSDIFILVEGNIDVVTLHQAGFDNAVAPLGTALTQEQAHLMSRHINKVSIAFDSDASGKNAALKAIPLLEKAGLGVNVVNLGDSGDPDDYIRKHGSDSFSILLERSDNQIDYQLLTIKNSHDITTDNGRLSYLAGATDLLSGLTSAPEREIYGAKVASVAGVSAEAVKFEVKKKIKGRISRQNKEFERRVSRPTASIQPQSRELRYSNEFSAAAEEGVIRSIIKDPALIKTISEMEFGEKEFTSDFLARIFNILLERANNNRDIDEALIMAELESHEASQLIAILQRPESASKSEEIIREYIEKIRTVRLKTDPPSELSLLELRNKKRLLERK